jgi:two-component system response regulator RegA
MIRDGFYKILLCDDDAPFRRRLAKSVRDRGFEVYEAENAHDGLAVVEDYEPHGVVVDMRMPGESGLWLVKAIKESGQQDTRVVVLTGFGSITTALEAMRLGAVHYLTKPVKADALLAAFFPEDAAPKVEVEIPSLAEVEAEYVNRVLAEHDGNVSQSAKVLGLARRSLQRRLRR